MGKGKTNCFPLDSIRDQKKVTVELWHTKEVIQTLGIMLGR